MNLRTRFLLAFSTIIIAGACLLLHWILEDVKPRYREAVEESLIDTANVMASLVERQVRSKSLPPLNELEAAMEAVSKRRPEAKIFDLVKTRIDLTVYVTDATGTVLLDTDGDRRTGEDYSTWNDVFLTLRGEYGARTTRTVKTDPSTSSMYVAAPINGPDGKLVGVLTVVKPVDAVLMFMRTAKKRLYVAAAVTVLATILLVGVISAWVTRPLQQLTDCARAISEGERAAMPDLGAGEIAVLARTISEMREALEGRKYVEQYVHTLSHEMKAPLAAITGAAELLGEDMARDDRQRFLANIRSEGYRIKDIVDRMLLLASLESRRELRSVELINVKALVDEVLASMAPVAEQRSIELDGSAGEEVELRGERFLVRHALTNLLQNALDFTPANGTVQLSAVAAGIGVEFAVDDSGVGIPEFARDKVFERFYSLERPGTGRKSSGLGLAFVREVAALHGGEASIEDRDGGGTRARLVLPLDDEHSVDGRI